MKLLDTSTIILLSVLVDVVLVFVLVHTWRTRTTYAGFTFWIAGTACWSVGAVLAILLGDRLPPFVPKIIGNGLIMLHPHLLYEGILRFHRIPNRWWGSPLNIALIIAALLNQWYFLYVVDNMAARTTGISLILAILFARTAIEPLFYSHARRHSMQWLLSACLMPLIGMFFVRAWWYCSVVPPLTSITMITVQEPLFRWLNFYGIIVELVIAYSYLSLTSDRVEEELRRSEESYRELSCSLQEQVQVETERRLAQERILAQQAKHAAMGEMIGVIAHQWRQPLATLGMMVQRTHAMGTLQGLTGEQLAEFKAGAMRQIRHMSDTIDEFRGFYRPEKQKGLFSPSRCVRAAVQLLEHQFASSAIVVEVDSVVCADRLVSGFPNEFKQVILNLLCNSRDAILEKRAAGGGQEEGCIRIEIYLDENGCLIIDISDNGPGIPDQILSRVFDPYFSTKEEKGGTGIGLYMSRMIVEGSLGGFLRCMNGQAGALLRIGLPVEKSHE